MDLLRDLLDVNALLNGQPHEIAGRVLCLSALAGAVWLVLQLVQSIMDIARINAGLATVPQAPDSNWLLGNVFPLMECVKQGRGAWDVMEDWIRSRGPLVRYRILGTHGVALSDPQALKRIFQTGFKIYEKDLDLSYKPFLPILGTGLVTANGEAWQKGRLLIGPALRTEMLDDIIWIAKEVTDRLSIKLEEYRGTGKALDVEEEFRLLKLQSIGKAILSLEPEECDKVGALLHGEQHMHKPHPEHAHGAAAAQGTHTGFPRQHVCVEGGVGRFQIHNPARFTAGTECMRVRAHAHTHTHTHSNTQTHTQTRAFHSSSANPSCTAS